MNSKKYIKVTGVSNISWKDAIVKTVSEASQTLSNLSSIKILNQRAKIQDDKIVEYYADLEIEFEINKAIKNINIDLDE